MRVLSIMTTRLHGARAEHSTMISGSHNLDQVVARSLALASVDE
jgi:hypothetical protein